MLRRKAIRSTHIGTQNSPAAIASSTVRAHGSAQRGGRRCPDRHRGRSAHSYCGRSAHQTPTGVGSRLYPSTCRPPSCGPGLSLTGLREPAPGFGPGYSAGDTCVESGPRRRSNGGHGIWAQVLIRTRALASLGSGRTGPSMVKHLGTQPPRSCPDKHKQRVTSWLIIKTILVPSCRHRQGATIAASCETSFSPALHLIQPGLP